MKVYFVEHEIEDATNYVLANNPFAKINGWTYAFIFSSISQLCNNCCEYALNNPNQMAWASSMGVTVIAEECSDDMTVLRVLVSPSFGNYELSRMA